VGLCHHCSAGLCAEHARAAADPVMTTYPLCKTVILPRQARLILCATCLAALQQISITDLHAVTHKESGAPAIV
jgi:hypothetical protein